MKLEFDSVLHQPVRTKIMAYIMSLTEADFNQIKNTLALSDGHMSTHMKVLVEEGYLEVEKTFVNKKPRTTYRTTIRGREAFNQYLETLRRLL